MSAGANDLLTAALAPQTCAALVEACPDFFAARPVSPLDVLLQPDLLAELADSTEAQSAAAVLAQAAGEGAAPPDAVGLFVALRRELSRRQAALQIPRVRPETIEQVARETARRLEEPDRSFALLSALVAMAPPTTKPAIRLALLVASLGRGRPHEAVGDIDRLLGSLLARPIVAQHLFAERLPVAARISALLDAAEGRGDQLAEVSALLSALVDSDAYVQLAETRRGARAAATALLGQPGSLGGRRDRAEPLAEPATLRALADELAAMRDLGRRIRRMAGPDEQRRLRAALRHRATWLLQEQVLTTVLAGLDTYQGLRALFELQASALDFEMRPVDERLRRMLADRNLSTELRKCATGLAAQVRMFGELQKLAAASGFPQAERDRLVKMFDGFQLGVLKRGQFLTELAGEKRIEIDLILQLADLCASGDIPEGEARTAVHRALQRAVRRPQFFRAAMDERADAGLDGEPEDGEAQEQEPAKPPRTRRERLEAVLARLRAGGIACRSPQDLRILVADDEPGARNFVRMVLQDLAVGEIRLASHGQEAMEIFEAEEGRFDLVIADWRMPRLTGLELLKRIRKSHPDMPFLMITALATVPAVREAMHFEVDGYLAKPFPPEQLEEKILTLINR